MTDAGDTIRSDGEQFKGKALIVDIMGTWCHNCMDAAPLLQELYTEYRKEGLEIVALSFEISSDPSLAKKNISLFRRRYGITYPVLFCGSIQETNIAARLHSQLVNFSAYPTTIFIDKQGVVRIIHVGFHGQGTGTEYRHQTDEYHTLVKTILHIKEE
jgi:thiol-disulfide isomerase/thioredoxin